jgi:hypothetical protein
MESKDDRFSGPLGQTAEPFRRKYTWAISLKINYGFLVKEVINGGLPNSPEFCIVPSLQ